jgi:methyl-accepting chemotaxis protein
MKIKVFFITCLGLLSILIVSTLLVYIQMRTVNSINFDTLTESLYQEDSKILSYVLSAVSMDRIETMKLPESWAEILVVNNSDLTVVSSTNPKSKGLPLHRHPELLDQASYLMKSMKTGKSSIVTTHDYMVIIHPISADQSLIALKPKTWEKGLVAKQDEQIGKEASKSVYLMIILLGIGLFLAVLVSFLVADTVVRPLKKIMDAFKALSLGDFDNDLDEVKGKDMKAFSESYLRLKTSLTMALERLGRK